MNDELGRGSLHPTIDVHDSIDAGQARRDLPCNAFELRVVLTENLDLDRSRRTGQVVQHIL
jgi:hypothetical protein